MKFALTALVLAFSLAAGSVFAADAPAKVLTPQQQKMKGCNAEAKGKKGDERRAFMSTCLKGGSSTTAKSAKAPADAAAKPAADAATPPAKPLARQTKKACTADARQHHLTGAARKSFIDTCRKGEQTASLN